MNINLLNISTHIPGSLYNDFIFMPIFFCILLVDRIVNFVPKQSRNVKYVHLAESLCSLEQDKLVAELWFAADYAVVFFDQDIRESLAEFVYSDKF